MPEFSNGLNNPDTNSSDLSWKLGPRDFIFKNLKYIPWVLICVAIAAVLAFLNIRYTTPIFSVKSSLLINNENTSDGKSDRFDAMFMNPGTANLNNEVQILSSRPVLQRVSRNLHLITRYYNIGK